MNCPKCSGEYLCGCMACASRLDGKVRALFLEKDLVACGHCGHTMHCDAWLDEEMRQAELKERTP